MVRGARGVGARREGRAGATVGRGARAPGPRAGSAGIPAAMNADRELREAFREGDPEAYQELVRRYYERIVWVAYSILHHEEDARDVAQETFLRVYRSASSYDPRRSFYTWIYRIAVNLSIDALRRRGARPVVPLEDVAELIPDPFEGSADLPERKETARRIERTLAKLPQGYRVAIVLRDIHELSCKEIAKILGCSHAAARWRLHRARKMFREQWEVGVEGREAHEMP